MKNLLLVSLFFIGVISSNDDVWKPTNDYHLKCSNSRILYTKSKDITEGLTTIPTKEDFKKNMEIYAHYDLKKDKKNITFLNESFRKCSETKFTCDTCCKDRDDLIDVDNGIKIFPEFFWDNVISSRNYSDDTSHRFIMKSSEYIGTITRVIMKNRNYERTQTIDLSVSLNREDLTLRFREQSYQCSLITAGEYLSGISVLKEKRDSLTQAFIEKRKGKLKV